MQNCKTQLLALSCLSFHPHGMNSHWTDGHDILYLSIFLKICQENQVSLKSDKTTGTVHEAQCTFMIITCSVLLRIKRNVSDKSYRANQNTHFMFNNFFLNHAFNGIIWKNIVELARPQRTIWRMCRTCWIPKATNTHSEYVICIVFPLQQWLHKCASMLHYKHTACLV